MNKELRIQGVVPPVPTPLTVTGGIDKDALVRVIEHLVEGGCDAIFVLGSTGELASLSRSGRETVIRVSTKAVGGKIPVIIGIADTCPARTVSMGHFARDAGADAVVMAAPYYYDLSADELRRYFTSILPQLDLPVLLYNMPWLTGHVLEMDCLRSALEHPNVIGFKDSSGDMAYLRQMIDVAGTRDGTTVLVGNEYYYLEALRMGAHGAIAGGANVYPQLFRGLQDAFDRGDLENAAKLQTRISALGDKLFGMTGRPTSTFSVMKAGLAVLGLCSPRMAAPLTSCTDDELRRIREILVGSEVMRPLIVSAVA